MQAQAYEGYFKGGLFYTADKMVRIPEHRRVYLTVLEESVQDNALTTSIDWVDELERMVEESSDEKLHMENFPRMDFGREPITLSDEG